MSSAIDALAASYDSDSDSDSDNDSDSTCSSTDSGDEEQRGAPPPPAKRQRPPAESAAPADADGRHQGRLRQFGHVAGNWPTYAFIAVEPTAALQATVRQLAAAISALLPPPASGGPDGATRHWMPVLCGPHEAYHLSLSRTFPLRLPEIDAFRCMLRLQLKPRAPFTVTLDRLRLFTNDDRSRSFVSLAPGPADQARLAELIREAVDPSCAELGKPEFYRPAEPHVSVLWVLGDVTAEHARSKLDAIDGALISALVTCDGLAVSADHAAHRVDVAECHTKCGNRVECIELEGAKTE
eukprot:SAG22_NODE_303_length_12721_cov_3.439075_10_plen_297_part_00